MDDKHRDNYFDMTRAKKNGGKHKKGVKGSLLGEGRRVENHNKYDI